MTNAQDISTWAKKVIYKDWVYNVGLVGDQHYLQISFEATDAVTGEYGTQWARQWLLDKDVDESGFIRVAHMATHQAVKHEVDEQFKYDESKLFNPHMNYSNLAAAVKHKIIGLVLKKK